MIKTTTSIRDHVIAKLLLIFSTGAPVLLVPASLLSQPSSPASGEDAYTLSPFEVDASNEERYRAANTLAGSRLNSNLKDVSAVIDVYTKDFMDDIGATGLESVLEYGNNMEKDTEDTIHGLGHKNISTNINFAFRVRGLPASRARNYFVYNFPIDSYNVERLDESRGPNSILFGFGSPGGIINMATKRALTETNFGSIEAAVGDELDNRFQLDHNFVISEGKAAFRINLLHQEETGWRYLTEDNKDAYSFAATFRPFEKTTIRLDYERFEKEDMVARPGTFWSRNIDWEAAGKPLLYGTWNDRNNATLNPHLDSTALASLARTDAQKYWVISDNDGQIRNWALMARTNMGTITAPDGTRLNFGARRHMVTDMPPGILSVNTMGEGTGRDLNLDVFTASLQQELAENLHLEISMLNHESRWISNRRGASSLWADPNAYLPIGTQDILGPDPDNPTPNPYAGQLYMESFGSNQLWITDEDTTDIRAALAYELDAGEIFGQHRIAALLEKNDYTVFQQQLHEQVRLNGELADKRPNRIRNQIVRRHYITDPTNPRDYVLASIDLFGVPQSLTLPDGTVMTTSWEQYRVLPEDFTKTDDIWMLAVQSQWLDGRLNTIASYREDDVEIDDWGSYRNNGDGAYERNPNNKQILPFPGINRTFGAVYHLNDHFSVFANSSSSIGLPGLKINYAPTGQFMDPTKGEGEDYGIKFSFLDNRLQGMATYYKASSRNETDTQGIGSWGVDGSNNILEALFDEGLLSSTEVESMRALGIGGTRDSDTDGIEFSISGRIARNWDIRANYSYTDRVTSNIFPRVNRWADETLRPFWATLNRDNPNTPESDNILDTVFSEDSSIQEIIDNFEDNLKIRTITLLKNTGTRPHKFNLWTSYAFDEGKLNGLRIGGGMRYNSANIAGEDTSGKELKGFSHTTFDLFGSYSTVLFGRNTKFQVNISDAFKDDPEATPSVMNLAGNWNSIFVHPPRRITFRVRVDY